MKKAVSLLLLLAMLFLTGCMPGDYSDELLKKTKNEYLDKGKVWFSENLPEVKVLVMDYRYSGASLTDSLTGSYKYNGRTVKYMLMPDSGELYTDELIPELETAVREQFCARTGLDAEAVDDLFILWDIPYYHLPGDLAESQKSPGTTGKKLLPYTCTFSDVAALADEILTDPDCPAILGLHIKAASPTDIDLSAFLGLTGLETVTVVTGEDENWVYEIKNEVTDSSDGALCQTLRLIKRKRISTAEEILCEVSAVL